MLKNKLEYGISILLSLAMLEFGSFFALCWFWSGFEWSPFGYETCGLEYLLMVIFAYPSFVFGLLIRWNFPHYVWYLPLILCGIISCIWFKSLEMGIFCIAVMLFLPVIDFLGCRKAAKKEIIINSCTLKRSGE